jgi:hypothetical protein
VREFLSAVISALADLYQLSVILAALETISCQLGGASGAE